MAAGGFMLESFQLSSFSFQTCLVFCLAFLLAYLFLKGTKNLPPYPAGCWPVLGHLLALGRAPHLQLTAWRRQYGDVFTVRMGMEDVVVLNGYTAVKDALVDRSELFASRPPNYIFDVVTGFGKDMTGERWGNLFTQKKYFTTIALKPLGRDDFDDGPDAIEEKIREEAGCLCNKVAEYRGQPFNPEEDVDVTIANVICSMLCGDRFEYGDRRFRELSEAVANTMDKLGCGQPISVFPFLRFIPGVNKPISGSKLHAGKIQKFLWDEISRHRQDLDHENPRDFLDVCLIEADTHDKVDNLTEENIVYIAQDLFLAGIDTITHTLRWSLLYMAMNPDIQEKVQSELDAAVGGAQPALSHRAQLPYTVATLMEVQRMRAVVPLGLPHATTQHVKVGQFDVPAGTQVVTNLHSLHMDPAYWPDPDRFDPERFLDAEGKVNNNPKSYMPFSGGRRSCFGEQLAKMELFLLFSSLLQNFTFKSPEGAPVLHDEGVFGLTLRPRHRMLCAIPR